jgi:predicted dehydrogenase
MRSTVRAVLVGCGVMAGEWIRCIQLLPDVELVGCVDIDPSAAAARASAFPDRPPLVGTDLDAVLLATTPDVVFDCTVPAAHAPVTLTALGHGCHVLGEKPLADSMANARAMLTAAKEAKRMYAVMQNRRYEPGIRRLKAFVESGTIGAVTSIHSDYFMGPHFGGFRDVLSHSLLLDMAIHTFDAARFISGVDARAVYCHEWNPAGSWWAHGPSAVATFEMERGVVYSYRGSWAAEGLPTLWESDWRIVGEKGSVRWNGTDDFRAEVVDTRGGFLSGLKPVEWPDHDPRDKTGGHLGVIREFIQSVQTGAVPETIGTDNVRSLEMVFAAIESAERGIRVRLSESDGRASEA